MANINDVMTQGGYEFDIIVCDRNYAYNGLNGYVFCQASHPDINTNIMHLLPTGIYGIGNTLDRGLVDMNFTRCDGSTYRINQVSADDTRLKKVDYKYGNSGVSLNMAWTMLPSVR
ncbi:MAG: hypothetical protein GC164_10345 [Phycisphaera sp.]|nr:hypothetical protein [Phycisphaera sp.]